MISAKAVFEKERWVLFEAHGHADYDDPGNDIVCAAFSCLTRTIARYCQKRDLLESIKVCEDGIYFRLDPLAESKSVAIAAEILILGLKDLEKEFPENIKLEIKGRE